MISDNGKGISKGKIEDHKSLGLLGIKERVYSLGGKIKIISVKKEGTSIFVTIPYINKIQGIKT